MANSIDDGAADGSSLQTAAGPFEEAAAAAAAAAAQPLPEDGGGELAKLTDAKAEGGGRCVGCFVCF